MSDKLLKKEQVEDVINFSQGIWAMERYGIYTPWMQNNLLNNLNNNPKVPTSKSIKEALSSYKENAKELQSYMDFMQKFDMIFARTLMSYVNTLSFDLQITCTNAFTKEDYLSKEYEEDKKRIYNFLDKFDYKSEFRKMAVEMMRHETVYTWFRKTKWGNKGMKCALQILPQDYCILTGYWEKGLLFDFNMNYFLQPGVDIDGYDPVFKKYYKRIFGENQVYSDYLPTAQLNSRDGTYAMWTQTSPDDGAFCFKFDMSNFNSTPYLAPFLKDTIRNDEIGQLQYNKDIASAYAILAGEIRLFDNAKSGTTANQFAIDPRTLGAFMAKAKQGLEQSSVLLAALPTENTKWYQYVDNNKDAYTNQLYTSAGVGSGVSRVIYSSDRMSNAEIEAGIIDQYNTMKPIYLQFNNFLDFFANKLTKKYKFSFVFDGCSYPFEREKRFEKLLKLSDKGMILSPSVWASAFGMKPQDFERSLQESKWSGWSDYWQLPINANTMSSTSEGGRPRLSSEEISESGESSRDGINGL